MQRQFRTKISRLKPPCARSPQTRTLTANQFSDRPSDGAAREPENSCSPPPPLRRGAAAGGQQPRTPVPQASHGGAAAPGGCPGLCRPPPPPAAAPGAGRPPRRGSCAARGLVTCPVSPLVSPPPPGGAGEAGAQRGAPAAGTKRPAKEGSWGGRHRRSPRGGGGDGRE